MKLLTAEEARQITLKYIQVADRKERADRIERTRKIIDYLYHRELRLFLKRKKEQREKSTVSSVPFYIDPVHTASAAAILGRQGGKAKSEAKSASSRENGKKGGRPRKGREEETIEESNLDLFK